MPLENLSQDGELDKGGNMGKRDDGDCGQQR